MRATPPNGSAGRTRPEMRASRPGLSLVILLTGSLLVGFSMGNWLAPLAAWIGPVLIIRYARDHEVGRGFLLVFAACYTAWLIGFGPVWWSQWSAQTAVILAAMYGLLWTLPYLVDRLLSRRFGGFSAAFVYPLAATTLEFINIHTNPLGAWGSTGFSQYGNLPLMQLASVTGMIGITFLMGWFASIANWVWENRSRSRETLRGLVSFGAVLAVVLVFGYLRLNVAPSAETVRVAGVTVESYHSLVERVSDTWGTAAARLQVQSLRDAYFDETVREAAAGAQVVLWPEGAGIGDASDDASLLTRAQEVARQHGIYLAVPFFTQYADAEQPVENKLLLIDPTGTIAFEHVKYGGNMMEGSLRGDGTLQTVSTPFGVLSGVICWDMDFPAVIQQAGQDGAGLMLVPSADWLEIDPIHSHMAVFRAIENGMSVARQTDEGLSLSVDPYGRTLAQTDFFGTTDRTMVAQVPVRHVATVYTAFGRWFEWLCVIGFLYVVARALMARRVEER